MSCTFLLREETVRLDSSADQVVRADSSHPRTLTAEGWHWCLRPLPFCDPRHTSSIHTGIHKKGSFCFLTFLPYWCLLLSAVLIRSWWVHLHSTHASSLMELRSPHANDCFFMCSTEVTARVSS